MADAFVDRAPIAWTPLLTHATKHDRALLESLRLLDRLRGAALESRHASASLPASIVIVQVVVALAAAQTICGALMVALASAGGTAAADRSFQLVLAGSFAASSILLGAAAPRDGRGIFLLAVFAAAASAFARGALAAVPAAPPAWLDPLFRGLFPEAFAPAALWEFAAVFPLVQRFTEFDRFARRAAATAWLIGGVLFFVNVGVEYGAIGGGAIRALARDDPGNVFWHLFVLTFLPAIAAIVIRAGRAPAAERRKVFRFAASIAAGTGPFLVCGVLRLALPRVNDWFLTGASPARLWTDRMIVGALTAMPMLTTIALVSDRPFERQAQMFESARHRLARLIAVGIGFISRGGHHERLAAALDRVRKARGQRELIIVLKRELTTVTRASATQILVPFSGMRGDRAVFVDPFAETVCLPAESVLVALLGATPLPVDLSGGSPIEPLLPACDRRWIAANKVSLMAPLKRRDGTIAAIVAAGPRPDGRSFDRRDRWFISTLMIGAAPAWDAVAPECASEPSTADAGAGDAGDDAVFECARCGLLTTAPVPTCGCHAEIVLASLPMQLAAKFTLVRRLGSGGMGVVYLARDEALGRHVALKTLPRLGDGMVPLLRDEARSMAALNHASIATIYGVEVWRGTPVLIVEYLAGGTLARRLARGPMPPPAVVAMGAEVARALAYVHERGMLHRDLKPSNIAFTSAGAAKILDFGLASTMPTEPERVDAAGTGAEPLSGTRGYLPPESYRGAPPDAAIDLWALSVVLLEAIAGRQILREGIGDREIRRALRAHLSPADAGRSDGLAALIAFFDRALAIDKASRFQTAADVLSALERIALIVGTPEAAGVVGQRSSAGMDVR